MPKRIARAALIIAVTVVLFQGFLAAGRACETLGKASAQSGTVGMQGVMSVQVTNGE